MTVLLKISMVAVCCTGLQVLGLLLRAALAVLGWSALFTPLCAAYLLYMAISLFVFQHHKSGSLYWEAFNKVHMFLSDVFCPLLV